VKRTERLAEATAPDGTVLTLYRHDGAYSIRVGGIELMTTRRHHSEDKLAEVACRPLQQRKGARVLIGGLGLGFTLRAALASLGADASVIVAEIVGAVIDWNSNPDFALSVDALADRRVEIRHEDIVTVLKRSARAFDAIILDVDNGADALTTTGNARLYNDVGIHMAVAALRPNGCLAYWSAGSDRAFEESLRNAGLSVDVVRVRAHETSGGFHTLFIGRT